MYVNKLIAIFIVSLTLQAKTFGLFETHYVDYDFSYDLTPPSEWVLGAYINAKMWEQAASEDNFITKINPRKIPTKNQFDDDVLATPYSIAHYPQQYQKLINFLKNERLNYSKMSTLKDKQPSVYRRIQPSKMTFDHNQRKDELRANRIASIAKSLAKNLITVSKCFNIDVYMFTALLQKESIFSPLAISPTGAIGLGQLVSPGITEAMMQSGEISNEARNDTIAFNKASIACIEQNLNKNIKLISQELELSGNQLITRKSNSIEKILKKEYQKSIKKILLNNSLLNLTYSAILFKTYLAVECKRAPFQKCNTHWGYLDIDFDYVYDKALQRYNAERNKQQYSDTIRNNYRKAVINFTEQFN